MDAMEEEIQTMEEEEQQFELEAQEEEFVEEKETADDRTAVGGSDAVAANLANEFITDSFEEANLPKEIIDEGQRSWKQLVGVFPSSGAAAEALYTAIFDGAPQLQFLFTTPRSVQALRFIDAISNLVMALSDPKKLKSTVEALAFRHMDLDVTHARAAIFRDAIINFAGAELGKNLTSTGLKAWTFLLNYIGGALMFVKTNYSGRVKLLKQSWEQANSKSEKEGMTQDVQKLDASHTNDGGEEGKAGEEAEDKKQNKSNVPTTYNEMFTFNAAVMGMGNRTWMREVLACFENIVLNVDNSRRLEEECDIVMLRISKVVGAEIPKLTEYKACMLSTLRGMLPKDWTSEHEVAWTWMWESVERLVMANMGNPPKWEQALLRLYGSLNEAQKYEIRGSIYEVFFVAAPEGENYFKQSTTYLHYIIDCALALTLKIYQNPIDCVDDVSSLGLRHVGYQIPTDLFTPFTTCAIDVFGAATSDTLAVTAFSWCLGLLSRSLVRVILEGSTVVMKAINTNTRRAMNNAVAIAPRGERAKWQLLIQVGTQRISPLMWSIDSGSLESASAIITDLFTFRADRNKYYYGVDDLFSRHPDIVHKLVTAAPTLLTILFDGMVWRSREVKDGQRRVNYYLKHLVLDEDGKFSKATAWIVSLKDPRLATHQVISALSDLVWGRVASRTFLQKKMWFLFTLTVFVISQSLQHTSRDENNINQYCMFVTRLFIYVFCLLVYVITHTVRTIKAFRRKNVFLAFGKVPIPTYLTGWQDAANLTLTVLLALMAINEPTFICASADKNTRGPDDSMFVDDCTAVDATSHTLYGFFAMLTMTIQFVLVIDMAVMSNKVSAYALICGRMLSEVGLFFLALVVVILCFSSGICALKHGDEHFGNIGVGAFTLLRMSFRQYSSDDYALLQDEPVIYVAVVAFLIVVVIFLINMLIAQLNCAYKAVYMDMVGYARLRRMDIIVETLPNVSTKRWTRFVDSVAFDKRIDFNAGDLGVGGGIMATEPGNANPTMVDMIQRFGGSTSPSLPWPEDDAKGDDEEEKFNRLQKQLQRVVSRLAKDASSDRKQHLSSGGGSGQDQIEGSAGSNADDGE